MRRRRGDGATQRAVHGAGRVIGIDRLPERLTLAREQIGSETIDHSATDSVLEEPRELTGGRGPDACIEGVGMEAHGTGPQYAYDRVEQALHLQTDRGSALREAAMRGELGSSFFITHRMSLEDAPRGYDMPR
jgi:threonine dehydrogenase-like Zn-dependent dehydrogenase